MHAIAADRLVLHDIAVLGEVPWCTFAHTLGINGIGTGLVVDADGPKHHERDVERERKDGVEDVEKPSGELEEVEERANDADVEIVVRVAKPCQLSCSKPLFARVSMHESPSSRPVPH